jgi:hypothetical protein
MAVSVQPGSARIVITTRPNTQNPKPDGTDAKFDCTNIAATGAATLTGGAGDDPTDWTLGFLQAQWIETNWAYYRGEGDSDGSLFVQRARPPARPRQPCRDCVGPASDIFYSLDPADGEVETGGTDDVFPLALSVRHYDKPGDVYPLARANTLTGKTNYLREAQLEFSFCAILSLKGPDNAFQHLSHFYWNVNWQASFRRSPAGVFSVDTNAAATFANVQGPFGGTPNDQRFVSVLTSPQSQNCNDFAKAETAKAIVRESRRWDSFDVRV